MLEQLSNDFFEKSEKVRAMGLRNIAGLTFDEIKQAQFQYDFAIHERDKAKRALDSYRSNET